MSFWKFVAIVAWVVLLLNLVLTMRLVRWAISVREAETRHRAMAHRPELSLHQRAPDFQAINIYGQRVGRDDYLGDKILFVFVSPGCGVCRREMPRLEQLAKFAARVMRIKLILVADHDRRTTLAWFEEMRSEDGTVVTIQTLCAPTLESDLWTSYNPRAVTPYFCYLNETGEVEARGRVDSVAWQNVLRAWTVRAPAGDNRFGGAVEPWVT